MSEDGAFGISPRSLELLRGAVKGTPGVGEAFIFGSRAMGNFKTGSDIDLALMGNDLGEETVRRLSSLLNEELPIPYQVDVGVLRALGERGVEAAYTGGRKEAFLALRRWSLRVCSRIARLPHSKESVGESCSDRFDPGPWRKDGWRAMMKKTQADTERLIAELRLDCSQLGIFKDSVKRYSDFLERLGESIED